MSFKKPAMHKYTYSLLRFSPDVLSGEAVNVGVVLYCPAQRFFAAKFRNSVGRVSKVFPEIDQVFFRKYLKVLGQNFSGFGGQFIDQLQYEVDQTASEIAKSLLADDASAFQWSEDRSGLTRNAEQTLGELFGRFVSRFDEVSPTSKKTEKDLWQEFSRDLRRRDILEVFESTTIHAPHAELSVKKAFKNGIWHCFEPVSFDLSEEGHINSKAYRWLGQVSAVSDADEDFKIYFLVAKPSDPQLTAAYDDAVHLLSKCGSRAKVYDEENLEKLGDDLEDVVKSSLRSSPVPVVAR
ncbi:hypothetical protein MACH10_13160 [Thalassospira tepidiphila]|uniref:DUF3037 domain-containing protein n=1 Tax=Thalassospira tepidiphila TaxID=393657 RepID=UPI002925D006|nr:hypothetical protein MACH10_13160 [Thalassospira tepidiphila]